MRLLTSDGVLGAAPTSLRGCSRAHTTPCPIGDLGISRDDRSRRRGAAKRRREAAGNSRGECACGPSLAAAGAAGGGPLALPAHRGRRSARDPSDRSPSSSTRSPSSTCRTRSTREADRIGALTGLAEDGGRRPGSAWSAHTCRARSAACAGSRAPAIAAVLRLPWDDGETDDAFLRTAVAIEDHRRRRVQGAGAAHRAPRGAPGGDGHPQRRGAARRVDRAHLAWCAPPRPAAFDQPQGHGAVSAHSVACDVTNSSSAARRAPRASAPRVHWLTRITRALWGPAAARPSGARPPGPGDRRRGDRPRRSRIAGPGGANRPPGRGGRRPPGPPR